MQILIVFIISDNVRIFPFLNTFLCFSYIDTGKINENNDELSNGDVHSNQPGILFSSIGYHRHFRWCCTMQAFVFIS